MLGLSYKPKEKQNLRTYNVSGKAGTKLSCRCCDLDDVEHICSMFASGAFDFNNATIYLRIHKELMGKLMV